eukprot:GHUV01044385.1.p1 GENE.GHUV01044385.1~~GHUV01044385.1.p1  ORF type:complete len:396 (+),score=75.04 GHUV01044385.1:591-1778(+)
MLVFPLTSLPATAEFLQQHTLCDRSALVRLQPGRPCAHNWCSNQWHLPGFDNHAAIGYGLTPGRYSTAGMVVTRRSHSLCLAITTAAALITIATAVQDRSGAFIGYSEAALQQYGHCQDKLPNCEKDASMNKCLTDPFNMRKFCPVSCAVEPCVYTGTVLSKFVFKGHASAKGTGIYARGLAGTVAVNHFSQVKWGPEDLQKPEGSEDYLQLSSLGLGTYLGASDDVTDEQVVSAVMYSATRGWNVIDTAANYRDGRAEAAIGRALSTLLVGSAADMFPDGRAEVTRDAVFISSKAGFLNTDLKQYLLDQELASSTDIVGSVHCLTRACIRTSVTQSLEKLRIETLDLLYLHNAAEVQLRPLGKEPFMQVMVPCSTRDGMSVVSCYIVRRSMLCR